MKIIAAILCLGTAAFAADAIHVSAGAQLRVTGTNATAAYSIDNDCAEVEVDGGIVVIHGKRPCTTHIVTYADGAIPPCIRSQTGRPALPISLPMLMAPQ